MKLKEEEINREIYKPIKRTPEEVKTIKKWTAIIGEDIRKLKKFSTPLDKKV